MARTRVVTRNIKEYAYKCLCMDIQKKAVVEQVLSLTGDALTDDKALKVLQKTYDTEVLKVVSIVSMSTIDCIYGMLETDFIKYASVMDENRHFIINGEVVESED